MTRPRTAPPAGADAYDDLVARLRDADFETRTHAARALVDAGEQALPALGRAGEAPVPVSGGVEVSSTRAVIETILADRETATVERHLAARWPSVRRAAAEEIGRRDEWSSIPGLIERLDDPQAEVRAASAAALRRLTNNFFGYRAHANANTRRAGTSRWRTWWTRTGRTRARERDIGPHASLDGPSRIRMAAAPEPPEGVRPLARAANRYPEPIDALTGSEDPYLAPTPEPAHVSPCVPPPAATPGGPDDPCAVPGVRRSAAPPPAPAAPTSAEDPCALPAPIPPLPDPMASEPAEISPAPARALAPVGRVPRGPPAPAAEPGTARPLVPAPPAPPQWTPAGGWSPAAPARPDPAPARGARGPTVPVTPAHAPGGTAPLPAALPPPQIVRRVRR